MNSKTLTLLLVSFALLTGGCSSLRPPTADPTAWQGDKLPAPAQDWTDGLYSILYDAGSSLVQ